MGPGAAQAKASLELASFKRWTLRKDLANARAGRGESLDGLLSRKGCPWVFKSTGFGRAGSNSESLASGSPLSEPSVQGRFHVRRTEDRGAGFNPEILPQGGRSGRLSRPTNEVIAVRRRCEHVDRREVLSAPGRFPALEATPCDNNSHIAPVGRPEQRDLSSTLQIRQRRKRRHGLSPRKHAGRRSQGPRRPCPPGQGSTR